MKAVVLITLNVLGPTTKHRMFDIWSHKNTLNWDCAIMKSNNLCQKHYVTRTKTAVICSCISEAYVSHLRQNIRVKTSYITCFHI
jgi:hypothetical protein